MRATNMAIDISTVRRLASMAALTAVVLLLLGYANHGLAQKAGPRTFASAAEACHALRRAVANHDEQELEEILGVGKEVTSQGDAAADVAERDEFITKYQQMHRLVKEPDGAMVLYIGAENWPFPIPLVSRNGRWLFDAENGKQEILFRQVGENEATAVQVCHALVAGKKAANDDAIGQYVEQRARDKALQQEPFHGYYFHSAGQPANTVSGIQKDAKPNNLAFVAYPAQYRSSGVLTFLVTQQGAVYEKDLGPNTAGVARSMQQRPLSGWERVD